MNAPTNPWRLVAAREVQVRIRDKAFIASFVAMIVILGVSFGLSAMLGDRTETVKVAVSSPESVTLVHQAAKAAAAQDDKLKIEPQRVADTSAVTEQVRSEKADLGLTGSGAATTLVGLKDTDGDAARYLQEAFAGTRLAANAQAAGTDLPTLTKGSTLATRTLDTGAVSDLAKQLTGMVFGFLFFFAAILFGSAIAQSVVSEKENRIVEILAGLVPIRQLLIGKIVGNTVLAMAQLVVFAVVGVIGLKVSGFDDRVPSVGSAAAWFRRSSWSASWPWRHCSPRPGRWRPATRICSPRRTRCWRSWRSCCSPGSTYPRAPNRSRRSSRWSTSSRCPPG